MTNLKKLLPELIDIENFAAMHPDLVHLETIGKIEDGENVYPIYSLVIGSRDKSLPTLGLFGGVHGLERIGTQVIVSFFNTLSKRFLWDKELKEEFKTKRIVSIPIVNPWGIIHARRSNPNGVDLMRNAPVDGEGKVTFLVGGHRISPILPWYRGEKDKLEYENKLLIDFVKKELFEAPVSIALDCHSGFGTKDQIWYPYARSKKPFPYLSEFNILERIFSETYPFHIYNIEPQSKHYTTHGDVWDYALDEYTKSHQGIFIPLTLELGSWNWVKKNPVQLFSPLGIFNPMKTHRYNRTMRRHLYLFDFLVQALKNHESFFK